MSFHTNLMILNIIALFKHSISICYLRLTSYGICVYRIFVLHILCNNDTPSINRRVRNAAWHNGVTENDIRCVCFCFISPPNRCPGCKAWVDKIRVLEAWEIYPCCHVAGLTKIYDVTTQRHGKSNTEIKKSVQCIFCGEWAWHFVRTFTLKFHTEFLTPTPPQNMHSNVVLNVWRIMIFHRYGILSLSEVAPWLGVT